MRRREFAAFLGCAAAAWPLAARARQKAMPIIGWVGAGSPSPFAARLATLRQGLADTGYVEGQNVVIEYRWAEGHYDRFPALVADLVGRKVDLIMTQGAAVGALEAKRATSTTPIVFISGGDPVAEGLVASLAHPGGNLTGISWLAVDLMPKLVELLFELVPRAKAIAMLVNPRNHAASGPAASAAEQAVNSKRGELHVIYASTGAEIDTAFVALANLHPDGLIVGPDPFFGARHEQLVASAARYAIPAAYDTREYTIAGGLISYGADLTAASRQLGIYAGRILKGERPADLPVQQPTKFELVINLKTARALGLTLPQSLLARADEVTE